MYVSAKTSRTRENPRPNSKKSLIGYVFLSVAMFKNVTLILFSVHLVSHDHIRFGHRHPRPWKSPSRLQGKPYRICLLEGGNVSECNPYFLHDATNTSFTSRPQTLEQAGAPFFVAPLSTTRLKKNNPDHKNFARWLKLFISSSVTDARTNRGRCLVCV